MATALRCARPKPSLIGRRVSAFRPLQNPLHDAARACTLRRPLAGFPSGHRRHRWQRLAPPASRSAPTARFFIDKRYRGIPIGMRVGPVTQDVAEQPCRRKCSRSSTSATSIRTKCTTPRWRRSFRNASPTASVRSRSTEPWRSHARSCRAARSYRDEDGRPWLEALPLLITMLPESPRSPYPITWAEHDRLFPRLPEHLARMALFALNTGLRDANLCGLQWPGGSFRRSEGGTLFGCSPTAGVASPR